MRSFVRYKEKRQPLDYAPMEIPIQWDAWLRHTRRKAPSIQVRRASPPQNLLTAQELLDDLERIRMVQHNARVLELRDQEMRQIEEEKRLQEHADAVDERERLSNQQRLEQSQRPQAAQPGAEAAPEQPKPAAQEHPAPDTAERAGPKPQKSTRKMIQLDLDPLPDSPPPAKHHD